MANRKHVGASAPFFVPRGQLMALSTRHAEALKRLDGRVLADMGDMDEDGDNDLWNPCPDMDDDAPKSTAIVPLVGLITQYACWWDSYFGQVSQEAFTANMRAAQADPNVTSIVMYVDSGGGYAAQNADTADLIREISKAKPVVAFIAGDGCSAGYFLASAASKIIVSQTAVVGSVGTVIEFYDYTKALEEMGIKELRYVSSVSPKKRLDPTSDEGAAELQTLVDDFGDVFVEAVAGFRGVSVETVLSDFGQGGVFVGAKAVTAGLADKVGTLDDAIQLAQDMATKMGSKATPGAPASAASNNALLGRGGHVEITAEQKAAIMAEAAQAERQRISAIMKLNTPVNRAIAGAAIDAAIEDGKTTAGDVALAIVAAQDKQLSAAELARKADAKSMGEIEFEGEGAEPAPANAGYGKARVPDTASIYARRNGRGN